MQQYMKAVAVMSAGQVQVVDNVPIPEPGDYEMLVKVHACGFWATRAQARWLSSVKK